MKLIASFSGLNSVASFVIKKLSKHTILILRGDLASGKTALVKAIAKQLGVKESVTSPTFALMSEYQGIIYHYDLYNSSTQEFIDLGLLEHLDTQAIHAIEWCDKRLEDMIDTYGWKKVVVNIKTIDNIKREYEVV